MSYLGICCISPAADGSFSVVHVAHDGLCFSRQLRLDSDATLFVAIDREAPLRWLLLAVVAALLAGGGAAHLDGFGSSGQDSVFARSLLNVCRSSHIRIIVLLMTRRCLLVHTERWSWVIFSGWPQISLTSLLCLAIAISGHWCRKYHNVSTLGWPRLRQNLHALRVQTSVDRIGSPALSPCPRRGVLRW